MLASFYAFAGRQKDFLLAEAAAVVPLYEIRFSYFVGSPCHRFLLFDSAREHPLPLSLSLTLSVILWLRVHEYL